MNTNLGRTECAVLINKSGLSRAMGDLVIVDNANALSFTTTTTDGFVNSRIGVILEPNGIANDAPGLVAFSGYVPRINLASAAALGDYIKSHTVAGQGVPHAVPPQSGDFAQALESGSNPSAILFGTQVQLSTGGGAYFSPTGLTGAVQASRYVGATISGAPVTGTFMTGDWVIDQTGTIRICTAGGSPGTWSSPSGAASGRTLISELTPSGVATTGWSGIPNTYKKLTLEAMIRGTYASQFEYLNIAMNGDTTNTNYRYLISYWNHTTSGTEGGDLRKIAIVDSGSSPTGSFALVTIQIPQYANTNFRKRVISNSSYRRDESSFHLFKTYGMMEWENTAAITQIYLALSNGNYATGSILRLYGEN